jgi:hypothetical protein
MKDVRKCPHCGSVKDRSAHVGGGPRKPRPGDLCICAECTGISVYTEGDPVFPTQAKAEEISQDPMLMLTIAASVLTLAVRKGEREKEKS